MMEYTQEIKGNTLILRIEERKLNTSISVDVKELLLDQLGDPDIINLLSF